MNLLPTQQKRRVRLEIFYQNIIFSGLILILFILILILILGGSLIFLNFKYHTIEENIAAEQSRIIQNETVKGMERKVGDLNKELRDLKEIQRKTSNLYGFLDSISQDLFSEVTIYTIEIDGKLNKITISGHADTRQELLVIKEKLNNSSQYQNVNFPISNLTEPSDIDFTFNFIYKP